MTIRWAHENIDAWLKKLNPEVAVIMFGTNDLTQLGIEEYEKKTREVVDRCSKKRDGGHSHHDPALQWPIRTGGQVRRRGPQDCPAPREVPLIDYFAEIVKSAGPTTGTALWPNSRTPPATATRSPH